MFKTWLFEHRRKKLVHQCSDTLMSEYLRSQSKALRSDEILAVDLETTGLNEKSDAIVSVGWVLIVDGKIKVSSSYHQYVNSVLEMNQSATLHGITDDDLQSGQSLKKVLGDLLMQLRGRTLLAHNASIETTFLTQACKAFYDTELLVPVIDTLLIEKDRISRTDKMIRTGELRLAACRERYHLPVYKAHNALSDALACAELYLAQRAN